MNDNDDDNYDEWMNDDDNYDDNDGNGVGP